MTTFETFETPGLVDLHTHLREPGANHAGTIMSETRAALWGGYVVVFDMPNTPKKETWSLERVEEKGVIIERDAFTAVATIGGIQPEANNIGDIEAMSAKVIDWKIYAGKTTGVVNDYELTDFKPQVDEIHRVDPNSLITIHKGKDNLRDFVGYIAGELGHRVLIAHMNNQDDIDALLWAKRQGWPVFGEVTPHHLLMDSHMEHTLGWRARMQPPLAPQIEAEKLMYHLAQGDIDTIGTDHAPHSVEAKDEADEQNPTGLQSESHKTCYGETVIDFAAPLLFFQAMKQRRITMERLIDAMSTRPAAIAGIKLDPRTKVTWENQTYRIENNHQVKSKAGWTPFLNMQALGKVRDVTVGDISVMSNKHINRGVHRHITRRGEII